MLHSQGLLFLSLAVFEELTLDAIFFAAFFHAMVRKVSFVVACARVEGLEAHWITLKMGPVVRLWRWHGKIHHVLFVWCVAFRSLIPKFDLVGTVLCSPDRCWRKFTTCWAWLNHLNTLWTQLFNQLVLLCVDFFAHWTLVFYRLIYCSTGILTLIRLDFQIFLEA